MRPEGEYTVVDALCQMDRTIWAMREVVPIEYHAAIFERLDAEDRTSAALSAADPAWDEIVDEMGEDAFK